MTQEDKENIIYWFEHIVQIADDRKTAYVDPNGLCYRFKKIDDFYKKI